MKITMRAARVNKNLTQEEAAKALGVNVQTYRKWETGVSAPTVTKFIEICDFFEVDFDNLIFLPQ